jgi:hypothetical protein
MIAPTEAHNSARPDNTASLFPEIRHEETTVSCDTEATADVAKLRQLATELQASMVDAVGKYIAVCEHIREAQLMPLTVTRELKQLGFADSRISEIKRVSMVSDAIWEQYKNRTIGFKIALDIARQETFEAAEKAKKEAESMQGDIFSGQLVQPASEAKGGAKAEKEEWAALRYKAAKEEGLAKMAEKSAKSVLEKTETIKPVKPLKSAAMGVEGYEGLGMEVGRVNVYIPKGVNKLPKHVKPVTIFDINGWTVEVRITRKKETQKPAKKIITKKGKK